MLPVRFINGQGNPYNKVTFFNNQFPQTTDCVKLQKQVTDIQKDITDGTKISKYIRLTGAFPDNDSKYKIFIRDYVKHMTAQLVIKKQQLANCMVAVTPTSPTVQNATIPTNTVTQNASNPTAVNQEISNPNTTTTLLPTQNEKTGLMKYVTVKNGSIAVGVLAIFAITYFATKKKSLPK